MLIYLLKATLVWGLSLAVFEGLLRKNSYHAANRAYLLGTLLAGLLLPGIELQWVAPAAVLPARDFVQTATEATQTLAAPAADDGGFGLSLSANTLWIFLYAAGFGIGLARVVRDARILARLRGRGTAEALPDGCVLHETGEGHGPFSFFRHIFLSSRDAYTPRELQMIIAHERQHARRFHSADMLLVQALKVVLWFHPLIHLYAHRLRLVHEYEADAGAAQEPATYGRFLIEQALVAPAATLTHAFHSPIKTRILMLTQNNRGRGRALRYALTIPLIAALVAAFSVPGYTDERKMVGNKLFYRGNEFTMTEKSKDTAMVENPANGAVEMRIIQRESVPITVNGEKIYETAEIARGAAYAGSEENCSAEYFARIAKTLGNLPDGLYTVWVVGPVISKTGEMIWDPGPSIAPCYTCIPKDGEPSMPKQDPADPILTPELEKKTNAILARELARGFRFKPAEKDGKPVASFLHHTELDLAFKNVIVVQNGTASMRAK